MTVVIESSPADQAKGRLQVKDIEAITQLFDDQIIETNPNNLTNNTHQNGTLSKEEEPKPSNQSSDDDLIPSSDSCYKNLKLRNRSVDLLQLVTARTILRFVLSLIAGEELVQFSQHNTSNRESIIHSVNKNQECLARKSRSETQLIIGQYLLNAREEIVQKFEESSASPQDSNGTRGHSERGPIPSLAAELDEQSVSNLVEKKLSSLISNEFQTYSYHNDSSIEDHSPASISQFNSIDLVQISKLMNFRGQVFYWNKFFDLIVINPNHNS